MERFKFYSDGALFFVTFSVIEWLPVFVSEAACRIMTDSLTFCHHNKGLRVNAFVVMPTHFHAILFHDSFQADALEKSVVEFRKFTGRSLADFCMTNLPKCFGDTLRLEAGADRDRRLWQPSRHPELINTESFWQTKIDYLHENPVRKGLVAKPEHWRFSSAAFWMSDGKHAADVPISAIAW